MAKRYGFIAFYEDVGHYHEGDREGEAHSLGILTQERPSLEQWIRFATLINHTGFSQSVLPKLEDMPAKIDKMMIEDREFKTRYKIIDCEGGEPIQDLFSDNIAYLKVVDIGEIPENESGKKERRKKSRLVKAGPLELLIPPLMTVYQFRKERDSRIGDRADEVFAKVAELIRIAN